MFKTRIKQIAIQSAVLLFFVMAVTAWIKGCSPATCAVRALTGAVATFYIVSIAGKLCVKVLVSALVEDQIQKRQNSEQES